VVDLHGGELSVHSVVGQGTRVVARLPLDAGGTRDAAAAASEGNPR
jgi:signal transduction histidine kinase